MTLESQYGQVQSYLEDLTPQRPPELAAMEAHAASSRFPIVGAAAGHFCYQMARLSKARRVFEMGSGFGYSTAWFARAVRENGGGEVHHVVWHDALSQQAQGHLAALGLDDLVRFHTGEAVATLKTTPGPFDLIFNDIDKEGYPSSLAVIDEKLRPGGVLIIDNALWHGRVFDEQDSSPGTEGVRGVTRMLVGNPRWITSLVPIRDGLLLALKRED